MLTFRPGVREAYINGEVIGMGICLPFHMSKCNFLKITQPFYAETIERSFERFSDKAGKVPIAFSFHTSFLH